MIRNLGQVAAIYIGSSAPRNTNLIWLDNTVVPFVFRAYDGSAWSEIATHKWVRAHVDGWLVTLPPRQLADDGDYMLINSNNVNYKITVKDFVKSAVGNPLDFKGIIRVSADFPNPSTLEAGDMYVIITSPVGGTVTDPYSGKTFEDSEKIVWDEVTRSWESLGKINITVNLTTSYSETEVTIHSSAGKETTIQGVTDQLAGVMLPGQYSWLQALSNGSIVPGDPSSLTPLTPAHKHNYNDIINRLVSQQGTGESTIDPMSQKATTDALNLKFDKASVLQVSGAATDKVMSQKAVTDALKTLSDDFNNKLTNYLPLVGGTMKGSIRFPAESGIIGNADGTGDTYILRSFNNRLDIGSAALSTRIISNASDLLHHRSDTSYKIWDAYNLPTPASTTDLANYLPLIGGTLTGRLTIKQEADVKLRLQATFADNHCIIQALDSRASQLGVFGYAEDKWAIGHNGGYYEIWDKYNLTNPVRYTLDSSGYPYFKDVNGTNFSYIKAGSSGIIPDYGASLSSEGSGTCGTSGWSFQYGYFANVYTNRIMFSNNTWTNDLAANRNSNGYLQVLDAYDVSSAGGPTNYGTVLQVNSRNAHWANQLWFPGGAEASKNGLYYRHMAYNETTYGEWNRLLTNKDVNILSASHNNNPNSLPTNQIFYAETQGVAGTPTSSGLLFSVQGDDEGIQLWASSTRTELYYRTKWASFGNWIKLATTSDIGNYLPLSGGTISSSKSNPLTINSTHASQSSIDFSRGGVNKGTVGFYESLGSFLQNVTGETLAVKSDGAYYGANINSLRKLATVTDLNNYLPLTGGTLNGALTINGPNTLYHCTLNSSYTKETVLSVQRKGIYKAAFGYYDGIGAFLYNYPSAKYLFVDDNGDARVGTTNGSTKLALITDIPTVSGYLPLSGGTLTGTLSINSGGSEPLVINNSASAGEAYVVTKTQGTTRGVMGWNSSLGMFLQDSRGYTFSMKADGVYFGASSSTLTKLLTSADLSSYATQSWVNTQLGSYVAKSGSTMTGALTMNNRKNNAVIDVVGGTGNNWDEGAGALSVQVPNDSGQTPLLLARRSGAAINTAVAAERLLSMEILDTGHSFIIGMSGSEALQLDWTSGKAGTGKLFGKTIATTDQIPSIPSISISNSGSGNAVTAISASGHTLTVTKGATYLTSSSLDGYATQTWVNNKGYLTSHQTIYNLTFQAGTFSAKTFDPNGAAATVNIPTNTSHLTNDSGFITSSALNGYATQAWVNSQNFVKSTSTKKVTDIQPVDALPATQASGVLYLVFG